MCMQTRNYQKPYSLIVKHSSYFLLMNNINLYKAVLVIKHSIPFLWRYSASSLEEPQFQCFTHLVFLNTGAEHRYIMHFKIDIHVL